MGCGAPLEELALLALLDELLVEDLLLLQVDRVHLRLHLLGQGLGLG